MKILIVDDDFTNRLLLQEILKAHGTTHLAVNGNEAVFAVGQAIDSGEPYDFICLDIMMPEMDGHEALREIRRMEKEKNIAPRDEVKILMITALDDARNVIDSFKGLCDSYLLKPIRKLKLIDELRKLGLVP